ncbi:hypothetical protein ABI59_19095 [Acidobacteria bacterium Mor1]|nr:hypothetical protein ABI59_19095 [Acidobacteria bacterium Mor1]
MNVAVVLYDGVELLDFAGPGEVFAAAHGGGHYEVYTVASSREPIVSQGFVSITPAHAMNESLRPDILIIPGGNSGNLTGDEAAMKWIADAVAHADHVLTVCTGAAALAKIGALDGLEATTHHGAIDGLRQMAPKATIHADRRFVDNGKIITTAGVSAGIDGALHLLRRLDGTEAAVATARYMEYDWRQDRDDIVVVTRQR